MSEIEIIQSNEFFAAMNKAELKRILSTKSDLLLQKD